jgi:hypothetical protein
MTTEKVPAATAGTFIFGVAWRSKMLTKQLILNDKLCISW